MLDIKILSLNEELEYKDFLCFQAAGEVWLRNRSHCFLSFLPHTETINLLLEEFLLREEEAEEEA